MKNKLKLVVIFVALFSMIFAFSSCGAPIKGEVFDGGNIEVFVPEGWKAFHGADVFVCVFRYKNTTNFAYMQIKVHFF